jgi:hypothetical protein
MKVEERRLTNRPPDVAGAEDAGGSRLLGPEPEVELRGIHARTLADGSRWAAEIAAWAPAVEANIASAARRTVPDA